MLTFAQLQDKLPPGITLVKADNFEEWQMDIRVMDENPIYKDEVYRLKFSFSQSYPIEVLALPAATPPSVNVSR